MSTVLAQKLWCTLWSAGSLGRFAQHMSNAAHQVSCIGSEEQRVYEEPHVIFQNWLMAAQKEAPQVRPRLACMATVDKSGEPVTRLTSIEEVNSHGITFFTTLGSRQAGEISANPHVSLHFNWAPPLRRSVRIEGVAEKISVEDSLKYFHQRPRASQIGAAASPQSQRIPSRSYLDDVEAAIKLELGPDGEVPLPNWGGYLVRPDLIEFWQGQTDRLHDRIRFRRGGGVESEVDSKLVHKGEDGWVYERLAP